MDRDEIFERFGNIYNKSRRFLMDRLKLDTTDLIRAIDKNDVEMAYRALRAGVNPNRPDGINRLPLPMAVDGNCEEIVELLLAAEANPNVRDEKGETALYKATVWENIKIIQYLMDAGAKKDFANADGKTAADAATTARDVNVSKALAGIVVATTAGTTVKKAGEKIVEKAAEQVVKPVETGKEAHIESGKGEDQVAKDKATHEKMKAKAEAAEAERKAAEELKVTAAKAEEEKERLAKEATAKVEADKKAVEEAKKAETVESRYRVEEIGYLSALVMAIMKKDPDAFGTFLPKVEDLNQFDDLTKESPLTAAINLAKIFDVLIENGADPYVGSDKFKAPIIKAIEKGTIAILPVLVQENVPLDNVADGKTLLAWAIKFKRADWVTGLLHEGVDKNAIDENGDTPLMLSIATKDPLIVETILKSGADLTIKNKDGKTAKELAEALGDEQLIALF